MKGFRAICFCHFSKANKRRHFYSKTFLSTWPIILEYVDKKVGLVSYLLLFFFLAALEFELRASYLLGRCSYCLSHSPILISLNWAALLTLQLASSREREAIFFFLIVLLFICAYEAWVISPPCPHPLPYHPLHPLPPSPPLPLNTRQKLFCPYLSFCWRDSISNNRKEQGFCWLR
jgi:hypothetical protein